jgi:hypothetical protein
MVNAGRLTIWSWASSIGLVPRETIKTVNHHAWRRKLRIVRGEYRCPTVIERSVVRGHASNRAVGR